MTTTPPAILLSIPLIHTPCPSPSLAPHKFSDGAPPSSVHAPAAVTATSVRDLHVLADTQQLLSHPQLCARMLRLWRKDAVLLQVGHCVNAAT